MSRSRAIKPREVLQDIGTEHRAKELFNRTDLTDSDVDAIIWDTIQLSREVAGCHYPKWAGAQ